MGPYGCGIILKGYFMQLNTLDIRLLFRVLLKHFTAHKEIRLEESTFIIGLPCSGMNTLISLLAVAAIFGYFLKGRFYKKVILLTTAIPIAILANLLRIVSILVIANYYGTEVAMRYFHSYSSILLFVVAFLCLVIVTKLLRFRFRGSS